MCHVPLLRSLEKIALQYCYKHVAPLELADSQGALKINFPILNVWTVLI